MIRFHKDIAQEIFNWLLENQFTNERVNACHEQFSRYIYDNYGNYAAGDKIYPTLLSKQTGLFMKVRYILSAVLTF